MNKSHFKHPIIGILLQTEINLEIKLDIIKVNFYMSTILFILKGRGKKCGPFLQSREEILSSRIPVSFTFVSYI